LQASRDVWRFSQRELLSATARTDVTDDDQPSVDPDAHARPLSVQRDGREPLKRIQRGLHRTHGVVLVRLWIAEVRENAITQILCDVSLIVLDHFRADALIFGVEVA
jgi:hypothetical protein